MFVFILFLTFPSQDNHIFGNLIPALLNLQGRAWRGFDKQCNLPQWPLEAREMLQPSKLKILILVVKSETWDRLIGRT